MNIRLLYFASYAEAFGKHEEARVIRDGSTVADLIESLRVETPGRLPPAPLVAVNQRYAALDLLLADGDEVALIPPVAGG